MPDMMDSIAKRRLCQPLPELERKASKASRRQNLWTQEEIDLAWKRGEARAKALNDISLTTHKGQTE